MRIGELAERSNLSRDTIRFYERNGLIASTPGASETNNYRDYAEDTLMWLEFVTGARQAGISIADLRGIVDARNGSCDPEVGREILRDKINELQQRSEQIERSIGFLQQVLDKIPAPSTDDT